MFRILLLLTLSCPLPAQNPDIVIGAIRNRRPTITLRPDQLDFALGPYLGVEAALLDPVILRGSFRDSSFYYLSGRVLRTYEAERSIVFSLELTTENQLVFSPERGCVLECVPAPGAACAVCRMDFDVPCRSLSCPCETGGAGCNPRATFWKH